MFEGVVSQVLAGYLGRYVKGIQKDQLKIGIWNEEILLEEVDLILESFDYLQLPFALKQGRIGKLSIKIPWKKLGWDSINIVLEDVFICACRRDDNEWTCGSVEKRELAAKMAKLNAAELAKFSKRVYDNQAGQSFITYVSTKILDNIQVYIQNVHLVYIDIDDDLASREKIIFGLRLASLTVKTDPQKQNYTGSYGGKSKVGQVNKIIEITRLGIYCNLFEGFPSSFNIDDKWRSLLFSTANSENELNHYLLSPFNVSISLGVNKSTKLEDCPQYMLAIELASLVILLNDNQLRQILSVWDYFSICRLREKYGRYRPIQKSRKSHGWQRKWWHYAQESILSDVRWKLRKTSWRDLGWRITCRRKYVNLYKRKLEFIQQDQPVDNGTLQELEQIEKECDIDDILSYRSIAEKLLPESFVKTAAANVVDNDHAEDSQQNVKSDELTSSRARSWLSWLSLGMLGAGGTTDTSFFSGAVSDEIIKDIYEATEFHPLHSLDAATRETVTLFLSSVKFNLYQINMIISSERNGKDIARVLFDDVSVECKIWEEKTEVMASINSTKIVNPSNENIMLVSRKTATEEDLVAHHNPFINVQLKIPPVNQDEISAMVVIQPFEFTCDLDVLWNLVDFQDILLSFQFHSERVLSSLNGIGDIGTRLLLKAEYTLSARRRFVWEASFNDVVIKVPWNIEDSECTSVAVLEFRSLICRSRPKVKSDPSLSIHDDLFGHATTSIMSTPIEHFSQSLQLRDLYDHFELELTDLEARIKISDCSHVATIIEKFNASTTFDLCVFFDEPLLRQLEVYSVVTSVHICLSPSIYSALAKLLATFSQEQAERALPEDHDLVGAINDETRDLNIFHFSVAIKMDCFSFQMNLGDDTEDGSVVCFTLKDITTRCSVEDFLKLIFHMKTIKVVMYTAKSELDNVMLCSSRYSMATRPLDMGAEGIGTSSNKNCYILHYQAPRSSCLFSHECNMWLHDLDLHIHPRFFGELQQFYDRLFGNQASPSAYSSHNGSEPNEELFGVDLGKCRVSKFYDTELTSPSRIPLTCFPFVTVQNSDVLSNLESSFSLNISEWRSFQMKDIPSLVNQKSNFKNRSIPLNFSSVKSSASTSSYCHSGSSSNANLLVMDAVLCGMQIYFHDSSCILGTIALPLCKSSLSFQGTNCWDLLCSAEGICLSSSWSPSNVQVLLGPALPNVSPILNIRIRREKVEAKFPVTEISLGIQHVNCTLPPEFLAIIIGYFALPDWSSKHNKEDVLNNEVSKNDEVNPFIVVYKFEILSSSLTLPVEGMKDHCIQLGLPLVYCSFIPECKPSDGLEDIPQEEVLSISIGTDRLDILNMFGHGISLLFLLKYDEQPLELTEHSKIRRIILIEELNADLWIRIPCVTNQSVDKSMFATMIVMKANTCNFVVEDDKTFFGLEAIMDAVDQFSVTSKESQYFKSDVLQFMQLKRNLKDTHLNLYITPAKSLIEIKVSIKSLSMKLNDFTMKDTPTEVIAEAGMQVVFAASLKNDILVSLDVAICGPVLHSFYSSVLLLSSVCQDPISHHIWINLFRSDQGDIKILFTIKDLDLWLHLSDWNRLIDLLDSYTYKPGSGSSRSAIWKSKLRSYNECQIVSSPLFEQVSDNAVDLTVKSENVSISFHLPLGVDSDSLSVCRKAGSQEFQNHVSEKNHFPLKDNHQKFVKFTLKSKDIELISNNRYVKLKSNIKNVSAILEVMESCNVSSMPFVLSSEVEVAAELVKAQLQFNQFLCVTKLNSVDIGLSYDIFKFWHGVHFIASEAASTEISLSTIDFSVDIQKGSIMLSDGEVKIVEILVKDALIKVNEVENAMDVSGICKFSVNYNNIHKVMWEPFIEPWSFQLNLDRKYEDGHLNCCGVSDISLISTDSLNLNITEPLLEAIFRLTQVFNGAKKSTDECEFHGSWEISRFPSSNNLHTKRYAPYILYNETSLPLSFWVSHGPAHAKCFQNYSVREGNRLQPGSSAPIYVEETTDNLTFYWKASHSSEKMYTDKRTSGISHHMISIQIDGTSMPSKPMSMDLVGVSYFEVNFSDTEPDRSGVDGADHYSIVSGKIGTWSRSDPSIGLVVPVVFDVSMHCYCKLIRVYSTVILLNASSAALELRFDIPFGISPKILGPIFPLQEFPLPLHLAETGQMRWRPVGSDYLWSDAHSLANLLSKENKSGFLRSFVCYPSRPTSYPFRCCISIEDYSLHSGGFSRTNISSHTYSGRSVKSNCPKYHCQDMPDKWLRRQVKLTTPLLVRNWLPTALSLTIDSGGVSHYLFLAEDAAASVFHIDSSHDLSITLDIKGFMSTILKFSRADAFMAIAKLNGSKFSLSEAVAFCPDTSHDHLLLNVEKTMDAFCGGRELNLSVPFLLYNCSGIPLAILYDDVERKRDVCILPASYDLNGQEQFFDEENGLALLSSDSKKFCTAQNTDIVAETSTEDFIISSSENTGQCCHVLSRRWFLTSDSAKHSTRRSDFEQDSQDGFPCNLTDSKNASSHSKSPSNITSDQWIDMKVKACMYSPLHDISLTELMVRLRAHFPQSSYENNESIAWSNSFCLVPTSGSTNIAIPHPCTAGAFLISVTSNPAEGLSGRTRSVIFQPRYVICNACSKDLCYKQKGTNLHYSLGVGQHSHLHWTDKTRELLIAIRFNEVGGQWSGSFLPDSLGDAQVKMRNYVSGALDMVRVEVQNAGMSLVDDSRVGASNGTFGTLLILLSDDNTGFMPYKIDNFSMERLRVYQQKCEMFETVVHSYTSCQYAWDEPCYPYRLVIEVPGERILGAYSFDDIKDYTPVCLPQTSEKPERRLFVGVHAEGAIKVLSIIDSRYHSLKDIQESSSLGFKDKRKVEEIHVDFTERMTIQLSFIGLSLVDSSPQELIFASAKDTTVVLLQNLNQQRVSFCLKSLQIDNQLRHTPYPIMLSFDHEHTDSLLNSKNETKLKIKEENAKSEVCDTKSEYSFYLAAAKWRVKEDSLVSFEYVNIRVSPLRVDLEEQVLLHLLDLFKTMSSRLTSGELQINTETQIFNCCTGVVNNSPANAKDYKCQGGSSSHQVLRSKIPSFLKKDESYPSIPLVIPIGAPWQQIFLLARKKKKIYVEVFELAPIKLTLSFSSTPWMTREGSNTQAEPLLRFSSTKFQRGLMALVDIEGVPVHLGELTLTHLMASLESFQLILARHYTRQLLHEMYKVFGSVGVIGNPMGFVRNFRLGIKDFVSVFAKGDVQSPSELIAGMAQASKSLLSNTVYALSSATTQFSKAAHKGIIAFTFDEESVAKIEKQRKGHDSHGQGVLNEFFEGLTGLLQSPIRGAEEHGLPGVLSGIALGTAGLIARPVASILEATGKTAQSIRNRSSPHQSNRYRVRLPRPVARDLPLLPYSWEEAIGVSVLLEADNSRLKDEILVLCKSLKQAGHFIIITYRIVLVIWCSNLIGLGSSDFVGIADPEWVIEMEMSLESVIHMDRFKESVSVVGSNTGTLLRQKRSLSRTKQWTPPTSIPLSLMSVELQYEEEAEEVLQVLRSLIEEGETQRWGVHVLLRSNLR